MGSQLIGRPISQRSGFSTLTGASSGNSPDLSQYLPTLTPVAQPSTPISAPPLQKPPIAIGGFQGFGGMARLPYIPNNNLRRVQNG